MSRFLNYAINAACALVVLVFLLLVAALSATVVRADTIEAGKSTRPGDYAVTYRHGHLLAQFIDEGRQPQGLPNINRALNLDATYGYTINSRLSVRAQAGLTSSYFSHNGCSRQHGDTDEHIRYRNRTGFTGYNVGASVIYRISPHITAGLSAVSMDYQQSDKPAYERYTFVSAGLGVTF
jgi:opacity protein-like surface antigen